MTLSVEKRSSVLAVKQSEEERVETFREILEEIMEAMKNE
jgi:hypothetical protein